MRYQKINFKENDMDRYNDELIELAKDIWGYAEIKWKDINPLKLKKKF